MVWGAIGYGLKRPLVRLQMGQRVVQPNGKIGGGGFNSQRYIDQILSKPMKQGLSALQRVCWGSAVAVEDNAPCHQSRAAIKAKESLDITTHSHPPSSPDLNLIEGFWFKVKVKVSKMRPRATNLDMLYAQIITAWGQISARETRKAVASMEDRVNLVVARKGGSIGY